MTAEYIVGVATEEKYRRQGRMAHLMKQAIEMEHERGIDWVFLCPENPAVYDSLGFIPTYWRETTYYEADEEWDVREFQVMNWGRLEQKEKENVCFFVEAMLRNEEFDIYMHHSLPYMEAVNKELKALEGEIYVVKRKGSIVAAVNVIREENQHQITELVCSRQFGKEILEAIPDMLTVFDRNLDYIELLSSPDTNHVEGLSGKDKSHPNLKDIVPESEYRKIRANMEKVVRTGFPSIGEHSLQFEGEMHHYENLVCPLGDKYLLCMCRDVTSRENAQRELAAARVKAEESDRLKSAFLANMSHEIRTPLNAIVGFSRLVIDPGHDGDKDDYCNIIEQNSELLLCLFNDILDLSAMEAGSLGFVKEKVNVYAACLEEYERHRMKVNKGVKMALDDVDKNLYVIGDRMRIMQVLMNLLSNAAKFTPSGEIHFGYQLRGNVVQFYVKDTGIGIPANRVAKIFERFGKINNFAQGTGLGLTVSRMLVERMGGRIWVRSGEGIGTTFYFTLPMT